MSPRDVPHHIRLLGESDVRGLFDTSTALELARSLLQGQAVDGSRLSTPSASFLDASDLGGPYFKFKAATVGAMGVSGIRLIARRSGNTGYDASNFTAVYDHGVGALTGLVSEIWLSRLRTAAFGVASVEPLVKPGPLRIGLFGAGDVAAELVPLLALALPIAEIQVHSRNPEHAASFAEAMRERVGRELQIGRELEIHAEADRRAVVADADLILTATEANEPLVERGWVASGAVLCSMGSHNEVAFEVLGEMDRLVVDDLDYASVLGDAAAWIEQGHITREALAARVDAWASEVVRGLKPGRTAEGDRILALIQGVATGDVAFASRALEAAEATGAGAAVDLR